MSQISLNYTPREAFLPFHQRSTRYALMVCHRRAGKTVACVNELIIRGLHTKKANARYAYVAPFRQQAKEIAWTYLKAATDGLRTEKPRESELRVKLPGDVWITLYGADNPDALRGLYFDGIILDEFGDMKPSLMSEVILPCLADRQGWLAIIGTAKGRNQFYDYKRQAEADQVKWYYKMLKASESGLLPESELQILRDTMTEAQYEQEMECSFDAAVTGTYYADLINELQKDGQLVTEGPALFDPAEKVYAAADIGRSDYCAWWFWQPRKDGIAIIDYYHATGFGPEHYLEMLANKPYEYHQIWLPWDARSRTFATKRTTLEQFMHPDITLPSHYPKGFQLPIRLSAKMAIQHGIDAVRMMLKSCHFDMRTCEAGVDALRSYRRQWHEHTQSFAEKPLHDWASDSADAFRYLALVADKVIPVPAEEAPARVDKHGYLGQDVNGVRGYSLDQLFKEKDDGNWRSGILRL